MFREIGTTAKCRSFRPLLLGSRSSDIILQCYFGSCAKLLNGTGLLSSRLRLTANDTVEPERLAEWKESQVRKRFFEHLLVKYK